MNISCSKPRNVALIISKVRRAENVDLEACESILHTGYTLGRNGVIYRFHSKSSKMLI